MPTCTGILDSSTARVTAPCAQRTHARTHVPMQVPKGESWCWGVRLCVCAPRCRLVSTCRKLCLFAVWHGCCSTPTSLGLQLAVAVALTAAVAAVGPEAHGPAAPTMLRGATPVAAANGSGPDVRVLTGPSSASGPDLEQGPDRAMAASLSTAMSSALTGAVRRTASPGATAALYRCGTLLWSGEAGVKDVVARGPTLASDTLFVIASSTKSYVATLVMSLVESGALTLSTLLSRFYPSALGPGWVGRPAFNLKGGGGLAHYALRL